MDSKEFAKELDKINDALFDLIDDNNTSHLKEKEILLLIDIWRKLYKLGIILKRRSGINILSRKTVHTAYDELNLARHKHEL